MLVVLAIFYRSWTWPCTNLATAAVFVLLGSFSFVGIGMMAAILPLLYVERGAQMTFVVQSCLLLVSGVYYPVEVLPGVDAGPLEALAGDLRPRRRPGRHPRRRAAHGRSSTTSCPLIVMGIVLIPAGLWAFGRAERYAKRTGKLKRVG